MSGSPVVIGMVAPTASSAQARRTFAYEVLPRPSPWIPISFLPFYSIRATTGSTPFGQLQPAGPPN